MTTVSPKKSHDPTRVTEISKKLMENPQARQPDQRAVDFRR